MVQERLMTKLSCPTSLVNAPVDVVWKLLMEPAGWSKVFDIRITHIEPSGPAALGQVICGETGPRIFRLVVSLEFTEIDSARRTIGLNVRLPLGITVREALSCSPVGDTQCRVNYRCDFGFPMGWRGVIARVILRRELEVGPEDSLLRLTRAAELRYCQMKN
jgi:hypothetical protein